MNKLGAWTRDHFITLILAFTAGGFVFILAELLLERHWGGVQLVAPISAAVGLVLVLLAFTWRRAVPVAVLFLLLGMTGLFGTFEHFEARTEERDGLPGQASQVVVQTVSTVPTGTEGEARPPDGERRGGPPWLAPLSLSGLALLGGAATLAGKSNRAQQTL